MTRADSDQVWQAAASAQVRLVAAADDDGIWRGRLSSSALATAVAVAALCLTTGSSRRGLCVDQGLAWLLANENQDGGWGDCPGSRANVATTVLVWCAARLAGRRNVETRAAGWLRARLGSVDPARIETAVLTVYGADRTFAAPILSLAAVAGCLGPEPGCWQRVPQLPLELAALPQRFYRWVRLPVVSYALPALVAIGLLRHRRSEERPPITGWLRDRLTHRLLEQLTRLQPQNGGFLEAVPLTAFVVLSLVSAGCGDDPVVRRGVAFLRRSQRRDGSWPIDSELATWLTTLSVEALADGGVALDPQRRARVLEWLLAQQLRVRHPYTGAAPGGWAWTPLPGGVPDADDTASALVALARLGDGDRKTRRAAERGLGWLLGLQNADGGIPTFCRGWGRLPFDRSCPDLTAHAVRAMDLWRGTAECRLRRRLDTGVGRALRYLERTLDEDETWEPLWFGNQWREDGCNPVYGTSRVVAALESLPGPLATRLAACGRRGLLRLQNRDGGWGRGADGGSTIEETSLAIRALAGHSSFREPAVRGAEWLIARLATEPRPAPEPIGLYFASLWYAEELYPVIFAAGALGRLAASLEGRNAGRQRWVA